MSEQEFGKKSRGKFYDKPYGAYQYSKQELFSRLGDIRQLAGVVPYELTDGNERGVRAARTVSRRGALTSDRCRTDRGMSITDLAYQGIPFAFSTSAGTVHPALSGTRFHWLVTCLARWILHPLWV